MSLSFNNWAPDVRKVVNLCCADPDNLVIEEVKEKESDHSIHTAAKRCTQCNSRHYYMKAEPGIMGMVGRPLGD